jgi:hypothetical protein
MMERRPHPLVFVLLTALLVYGVLSSAVMVGVMVQTHGNDWGKFYWDAVHWLDGRPMYGRNEATDVATADTILDLRNLAAPHVMVPFLIVGRLGFGASVCVWALASAIGAALSWWIVRRELAWRPSTNDWLVAVPLVLSSSLLQIVLVTGQITFLVLPLVALVWAWARRERWMLAGFGLGMLVATKPFFLLLVPWLTVRSPRSLVAVIAGAGSFVAIGLAVFGGSVYREWFAVMREIDWAWIYHNASLRSVLDRAFTAHAGSAPLVEAPALALWGWRVAFVVGSMATLALAVRDREPGHVDRALASLIPTSILLSPLGWTYYIWWALPPVVAVALSAERDRVHRALLVASTAWFLVPFVFLSTWLPVTANAAFLGLLCLCAASWRASALAQSSGRSARASAAT